jgi:acetylornithine deacetylase/succinyl-diaminopimelate desuccinylase-like protein
MKNALRVFVSLVAFSSTGFAQSQDEAVRVLKEYVAIDSSNPPGNYTKAADFVASLLQREGIPVTRYEAAPGKSIVLARLKATTAPPAGKAILLLHHFDVVPADRSQWKTDPFTPTERDGQLWARGAFDMKGQGVAQILAFLELKRQRVPLNRDVVLLVEGDEEVGGTMGARWMIANHYADLDPEYVLDEGGVGSRDLFAPGKLVYGVAVAEKKIVWLKVRAEGVSGHGSQPTDQNPNDRLTRALGRLLAAGDGGSKAPALVDTMRTNVGAFAQNKFTNAIQKSTISITWMRSGVGEPPKINVIPSFAEAGLDCRVLPGTTTAQWIEEIRRRLGDPSLKIEIISESDDPVVTTDESPLYRNLVAAITKAHPDAVVTPILIPYGTDSNAFRPRGVKSYGIFPTIVPADAVASMHSDAEHLPLDAVGEAAKVLFEALRSTLSK